MKFPKQKLTAAGQKFIRTAAGRFILKQRFYILSFIIPFLILIAAYIAMGVFPFGDRQVQIIDSYHQYVPFFSEFYRKIWEGDSLFYSWNGGLGMNFWAIVAYYLASPLNILILLFPRGALLEGFTLILMLKVALSGLTFSYYISKHFRRYDVTIVYFSMFYSLCGWTLGYNWNIMWLDCLVLLPLIVLGLERLVKQGKGLMYGLTLGICILCNYYIAIMVCIFLVLYFFVLFFEQKKRRVQLFFRRGFLFAGYSLLAGALSGVLLLPTICSLAVSNSAESKFPTNIKFYHSITELLGQQFAIVKPTDLSGSPNLYFGVFALMLVLLYIFHKGVSVRAKVLKLGLLIFMLFSTNFRILDYIWHGFHFPNSLPARFTFIYAFLALTMAYETFLALRKFAPWQLAVSFMLPVGLLTWCVMDPDCDYEIYTYVVTGLLLFVYLIFMGLYKYGFKRRKMWQHILLVILIVEVAGNSIFGLCSNGSISRSSYLNNLQASGQVKNLVEEKEGGSFYRMELDKFNPRNNNMWLDYRGLSLFASTMGASLNDLIDHLGFFSATNKFSYVGATPVTDSIFGMKYLVTDGNEGPFRTFNFVEEVDGQSLYENPYALSLGFMVSQDYEKWDSSLSRPDFVINDFVRRTTETDERLLTQLDGPLAQGEGCTVEMLEDGTYQYTKNAAGDEGTVSMKFDFDDQVKRYIFYEAPDCDKLKVSHNDSNRSYSDTRGHFVELPDSGHVELTFETDSDHATGKIKLYIFSFNEDVFEEFYNKVSKNQWVLETFDTDSLKGTVTADEDGILFTSIPYDQGWHVKVDGQSVKADTVDGALLHIPLSAGMHTVEMYFIPQGFVLGAVISGLSCLIFVVIYFRKLRRKTGQ